MTAEHFIHLDMYQTAGVGVIALLLGMLLTRKVKFLKRFCIPSPVSGGLIFSLLTLCLYYFAKTEFSFDATLKDICMMLFFTSVGFQSNLSVIKSGGKSLLVLLALLFGLIVCQNLISVGVAKLWGLDSLVGMAAGSIPMCGGHGTAGGFSPVLESMGLGNAATITMAAATFGLIAGSMIGGPLAERLIRRHSLCEESNDTVDAGLASFEATNASPEGRTQKLGTSETEFQAYTRATYQLLLTMAAGTLLGKLINLTGVTFPTYFGPLLVAVAVRNVADLVHRRRHPDAPERLELGKIVTLGNICLSLFLGMAMVSLRLWELAGLALPLLVILLAQVAFMAAFAYFVAFRCLGRNYDSAVLVSGICGFGLGATPNAMANMSAVCYKYKYAVNPFVIVPIVGAMFVDLINTAVITIFLNLPL